MTQDNPLQAGIRIERIPDPSMMVIFGASGDLTRRKLVPAIFDLARQGLLPPSFVIVGVSRTPMSDDAYREYLLDAMKEFGQLTAPDTALWDSFASGVHYRAMDPADGERYHWLRTELEVLGATHGALNNRLFYLSTPPSLYAPIVKNLGSASLQVPHAAGSWTRIIVEKPFGFDLESARSLNKDVLEVFREEQVYRIDHYLGKETVQNLLVFRFANGIFEPVWNRNYIDHIQITAAETVGVGSRAAYYEGAGTLRDMVQNHMLQLLTLTAMEPPVLFDAQQVRDEKQKVLQAMPPIRSDDVHRCTVRGQYGPGTVAGEPVAGYRDEKGVAPSSTTETYVALRLMIENWRWAGVPFYIRSGKCLPKRITEIAVQFKTTPHRLFGSMPADKAGANTIVIRIQPDEGISLKFSSKIPGSTLRVRPVTMDFRYGTSFGGHLADAYTRLILDCMLGDATLYARADSVDAAWSLITPIRDGWASNPRSTVHEYAAGTWGPKEAEAMLMAEGRRWRLP